MNASARIRALDAPINGNIGGGLQLTCRTNRIGPDEFQTADQIEAAATAGDLEETTGIFLRLHAEEQPADTQMVEGEATENHRHWQTVTGSTVLNLTEGELFFIYNPTGYELEVSSVSATLVQLFGVSSGASTTTSSSSSGSDSGGGSSSGGDSSELTGRVTTLEGDVDDLESTVTSQGATISSQASTLASHTSSIATNASGISTNASAISSAASDISDHETRITDLETFETSATASIASNASGISTNTTDIGTNAAGIAANASAIADLETFETSATASIAANVSDIDDLETFQATTEAIFAAAIADDTYETGALDEITTAGGIVTGFTVSPHLGVIGGSTDTNKNYKFGWNALQALTTGTYNVAIGLNAGYSLTSGTHNVCIGRYAGNTHTTGDNCVFIGEYSGQHLSSGDDQLAIGFGPTEAEHWIIGDSSGNVTIPGGLTVDGVNLITYTAGTVAALAALALDVEDLEDIHAAAITDGTYETANGDEITVAAGVVTDFTKGTGPYGYRISNNTTDADHDLDIAAGACLSWDRTTWIAGSAMTKRFDAAWASGDGNGGIDTGSMPTDGGLYLYAIYHPSSGVDYIGSTAAPSTGPSLPTGYTKYAYIGYRPTDGSADFYAVTQFGSYHEFSANPNIVDVTNPGTSDITVTADAPEFAVITVRLYFRNTNVANGGSNLRVGPTPNTPQRYEAYVNPSSTDQGRSEKYVTVLLDDNRQFLLNVDVNFSSLRVAMWLASWRDERLAGLGT